MLKEYPPRPGTATSHGATGHGIYVVTGEFDDLAYARYSMHASRLVACYYEVFDAEEHTNGVRGDG